MSAAAVETAFCELQASMSPQAAVVEAHRCLGCFDAPCTAACPTHIDVPGFIKKIAHQNLRGSALRILDANILGLSCSRVCPVDVLCEGACVLHARGETAIAIGLLQRHAMEDFYDRGAALHWPTLQARPHRVACVGGGPASLACAAELRRLGVDVTIFESRPLPGGLNVHGVAEYKLRSSEALREVEFVQSLGVEIISGKQVGRDLTFEELESRFDAIFIGVGLGPGVDFLSPCAEGPRVIDALDYIEAYKRRQPNAVEGPVVVIGGGNTAIDAACAAKRLGAETVTLAYRRSEAEMPAFQFEIEHARHDGIRLLFQAEPAGLRPGAIEFRQVRLGAPDPSGRRSPEAVPGSEFLVRCGTVIAAIGQTKLVDVLRRCHGVNLIEGKVDIDPISGVTSNPKYFAGGDCVSGGREVVDAVADGKRAAKGIARMFAADRQERQNG